ncbi:MAG: hypothetical protein H6650_18395 [Ardenticatenales bacterium]|nr:hypothetical protein [Ardenticatenales bacterium]
MKIAKKVILIILPVLLLFIAFFVVQKIRNPVCESPIILFVRSKDNQPEAITSRLVSELGGLPKVDIDVYEAQNLVDADGMPPVYSVNEWAIDTSSVINSSFNTIFDDDPTYSYDFIIHVTYTDGDTAVLQYTSWSYGIVACPVLISMGSGPSGQLKVLP